MSRPSRGLRRLCRRRRRSACATRGGHLYHPLAKLQTRRKRPRRPRPPLRLPPARRDRPPRGCICSRAGPCRYLRGRCCRAQSIRIEASDSTDVFDATLVKSDDASGLALLKVTGVQLAFLPVAQAFAKGRVDCIGFPDVSLFGGEAQTINGFLEATGHLSLARYPRLAGGSAALGGNGCRS